MRLPRQCVHIPHNACARSIVQVCSFEWLIMRKIKSFALLFFIALSLAIGGSAYWLFQNEDKVEASILKALSERLKTDGHIESVHLDVWSSFPHVSLVLSNVHVLGSANRTDTLVRAQELALECNAWKLLQGQYQLQALRLEGAHVHLLQGRNGQWNTDVWKSSEDSTKTALFAIDELAVLNSTVKVGNRQIEIAEAFASLEWSNSAMIASGFGQMDRFNSPEWSTSSPLRWEASCEYDADINQLSLSMKQAEWMGANWQLELAYASTEWTATGQTDQLAISKVIPVIDLPRPWNRLQTEAKADGNWSWESGVFKSNWHVDTDHWIVPIAGEEGFDLNLDAGGKIWLKYEKGQWRADLPMLEITAPGLDWQGEVRDFLPQRGSFDTEGSGSIDWERWIGMPDPIQWTGQRPGSGTLTWNATIGLSGSDAWTVRGDWHANAWTGAFNGTPWAFSGEGEIDSEQRLEATGTASWDGIPLTGQAKILRPMAQLQEGTSRIELSVALDHWAYAAETNATENAIGLGSLRLPEGTDWTVEAKIGHLQYGLWAMENVTANGQLTPNRWSVARFSANTLSGTLSGDASIEFQSPQKAVVIAHPALAGCDLHELFFAFNDFDQKTLRAEHLTGTFGATGSVQFQWLNDLTWQPQTLDVLGTASISGGTLKNLEAFDDIADYLKENRMMAPLVDPNDLRSRLKYVELEDLESAVYISNESVQLPQVDIRSSAMNISLEGSYGFNESLDYTLGFAMRDLRNSRNDEFGLIEDDGLGQQFFIAMNGTVNEPSYRWDRDAQKNHRRENLQREKELLKTLFRRSSDQP